MDVDWGNVPAWAAFVSALVAVNFTWRALARERRRDADREERERREQANKIAAWVSRRKEDRKFALYLMNTSSLPVYDTDIIVKDSDTGKIIYQNWSLGGKPSSDAREMVFRESIQESLEEISRRAKERNDRKYYEIEIEFTDSAGVRWLRKGDGKLVELADRSKEIQNPETN